MPLRANIGGLPLGIALNKLKHHAIGQVNFTADAEGNHILFFFTNGGQGYSDTISSFSVQNFCDACKQAIEVINT